MLLRRLRREQRTSSREVTSLFLSWYLISEPLCQLFRRIPMNKSSVILQFSCFKVGGLLYTLAPLRVNLTGHPLIRFRPGFLLATIKSLESFGDKWFKEAILCVQEFLIGRV